MFFNSSLIRPILIIKIARSPIYRTFLAERSNESQSLLCGVAGVVYRAVPADVAFRHAAVLLCCDSNVVVLQYLSPAA